MYRKKGEFIYGDLAIYDDGTYGIYDREEGWYYNVDPETVGQYTGLKDKNGKKVYEGDIVRDEHGWYVVGFQGSSFIIRMFDACGYEEVLYGRYDTNYGVIGNIYDNPELLEVSE